MTAGDRSVEVHGVRVFECDGAGAPLRNNRDLNDLISTVWERRAKIVLIPVERLGADFFRLKTGVAGEIVQKFVQYHLRVAIVGDIARYIDESTALRDFVRESNRGNQVWFVASREELDERLRRK
jgi:hypothetical protein